MNNKKIKVLILSCLLLLFASSYNVQKSFSYTATIQELEHSNSNQLLRVSLDADLDSNTVNVNLYTSNGSPVVNKKEYGDSTFVVELNNTVIATTNNINIDNVSNLIKSVKIVPYLNTSNPLVPGMARVVIKAKELGLNYKVNLKQINGSKVANNSVNAKVFYPPGANKVEAHNLAVFTPLDDKTISDIPEESFIVNKSLIAQATPDNSSSLQLSPPGNAQTEVELPGFDEFVSPSGATTVPPVDFAETTPANETATSPGQEGQSPQPVPSAGQQQPQLPQQPQVKSVIPKQFAFILSSICFVVIVVILFIGATILLKMKKKKQAPPEMTIENSNLTDIEEVAAVEDLKEVSIEDLAARHGVEAFDEEVEEIEMLDGSQINGNKTLYLVRFSGKVSLIGTVGDNVFVLNTFHPDEVAAHPLKITSSKEGSVIGKEIFLVKVANWQGVVVSENYQLSLHTNLTVE